MSPAAEPGADLVAHLEPVLASLDGVAARPAAASGQLLPLFDAQARSRWLDVAARRMRAAGQGFYTIGSAGHEGDAAVALATRVDDPALLHYRSGGFYLARSAQAGRDDGVRDVAHSLAASTADPISGGRHKVFGHPDLSVVPTTSTIASHLPRAVGLAWTIGRQTTGGGRRPAPHRVPLRWPDDAIVVASFGDASANHSTATGAVNAACWAAHQGAPMPLLLVCEDNGLGISTPTPPGWVEAVYSDRHRLEYRSADSTDVPALLATAHEAAEVARTLRRPVLLHLRCVRIGGHAGSDAESGYRSPSQIAQDLARDPLAATMRALVAGGVLTAGQVRDRWTTLRDEVALAAGAAAGHRRLTSTAEVVGALAPRRPEAVAADAAVPADPAARRAVFGATLPEAEGPLTLAQAINRTLVDAAARHPHLVLMGEDVGRKGGVYGVTRGLERRLGPARVVDTLLDEQTILGLALGAGLAGLLPVPEIQYLAYLHNAEDQLRGEAASMQFFSDGAYRNPLVVRVQGLAYQKGFGGHFHNDTSVAVLRDVPGLVVAVPAHPADAPALLRSLVAAAQVDGTVGVQVEPIALYHERDLHEPGDGGWLAPYAAPPQWTAGHAPIGRARVVAEGGDAPDLTIATFGNGVRMSLRVARRLADDGVGVRVVDLRWLAPLPVDDVVRAASASGRLLVVDETRRTGGVAEGLVTEVLEAGFTGRLARVAAHDSYVPIGDAAHLVLVSEAGIEAAARALLA